jgi:c-di-GMP-binding flagellar brake protein YcgR
VSDRRNDTDKRFVTDRRKIFYKAHAPERRSGYDRRRGADRRTLIERREHKRFQAKEPTSVALWSEHEQDIIENMGQLLDISRGGLSLRCTSKPEESNGYSLLEIFLSGDDFNIDEIPFKIISAIEMVGDSRSSELTLKRYGIRFDQLTQEQKAKLDHFLINRTLGEA